MSKSQSGSSQRHQARNPAGNQYDYQAQVSISAHIPPDAHVFMISVAAELAGMHAQTLRTYDRLGLVSPQRTQGGGRRYSSQDVEMLRQVQKLSQEEGVNLSGIKKIIQLTQQVNSLSAKIRELTKENQALRAHQGSMQGTSSAVVLWQPRNNNRKRPDAR